LFQGFQTVQPSSCKNQNPLLQAFLEHKCLILSQQTTSTTFSERQKAGLPLYPSQAGDLLY
jgi:hypothetical protein